MKVAHLVQPSGNCPLLFFQAGSEEVIRRSPSAIKREFRALGRLVNGSVARVVFVSVLPVAGINVDRQTWLIST